ncbi:MAG: AzlC family ABC transporter permease [Propionibacteriaceae bacterium]|nr:AzlC family ABC transporter permease [Propionibacteriaceae bacterium]
MSRRLTPAQQRGVSVGVATGLYGISFGALAVVAGLNVWQAQALSLLMFTGGSQFAFIGVLAGGGTLGAATAAASLLGVRNAVYGVTANAMLRPRGWQRAAAAQVTIDESIAVASGQEDPDEERRGFWAAGIAVFVLWNLCTLLGAALGDALGDPKAWGLDGAAIAAFLGLLWPRLKSRDPIAIAVLAAVVTLLVAPFVPPGIPIIVAAAVSLACGFVVARSSVPERTASASEPPSKGP